MKVTLKKIIIVAALLSHSILFYGCGRQGASADPAKQTPSADISKTPETDREAAGEAAIPDEESLPELSPTAQPPSLDDRVTEAADGTSRYVNGHGIRMRGAPSTKGEILMQLDHGTEIIFLSVEGDWSKVLYGENTGYIRSDLLMESRPEPKKVTEEGKALKPGEGAGTAETSSTAQEQLSSPKIIVKKSERLLELWDGDSLYASYPIGLGWSPEGDKEKEGDGRTPEGTYYVCTRNSNSRFYLSLGVSYPNREDADRALEEGRIDRTTHRQIANAIDDYTQPPWNTAMGGEIMLHGMGSSSDWTAGCIAVDNEIMDILWEQCPMKTPIIIEP